MAKTGRSDPSFTFLSRSYLVSFIFIVSRDHFLLNRGIAMWGVPSSQEVHGHAALRHHTRPHYNIRPRRYYSLTRCIRVNEIDNVDSKQSLPHTTPPFTSLHYPKSALLLSSTALPTQLSSPLEGYYDANYDP